MMTDASNITPTNEEPNDDSHNNPSPASSAGEIEVHPGDAPNPNATFGGLQPNPVAIAATVANANFAAPPRAVGGYTSNPAPTTRSGDGSGGGGGGGGGYCSSSTASGVERTLPTQPSFLSSAGSNLSPVLSPTPLTPVSMMSPALSSCNRLASYATDLSEIGGTTGSCSSSDPPYDGSGAHHHPPGTSAHHMRPISAMEVLSSGHLDKSPTTNNHHAHPHHPRLNAGTTGVSSSSSTFASHRPPTLQVAASAPGGLLHHQPSSSSVYVEDLDTDRKIMVFNDSLRKRMEALEQQRTGSSEGSGARRSSDHQQHRVGPQDFKVLRLLGKGDVGRVYLVIKRSSGELFAMKMLKKRDMLARNKVHRLMTEWEILVKTDHPFISKLHYSFQSKTKLYFIMEYCAGGEFYHYLRKQPNHRLSEPHAQFYAAEILIALEYLHANDFVYRDVKPENILIHESGHLRLTDFDLAKRCSQSQMLKLVQVGDAVDISTGLIDVPRFNSFVGTVEYLAPEVVSDQGHNAAVDFWGFGVLIYEMLYGCTPFKGANHSETFQNIIHKGLKFPATPKVSSACKDLITRLLHPNPLKRLGAKNGAADVRAHKWWKEVNFSLIRNMEPPWIPVLQSPFDTGHFRKYQPADTAEDPLSDHEQPVSANEKNYLAIIAENTSDGIKANDAEQSTSSATVSVSSDPFRAFKYFASSKRDRTYGPEPARRWAAGGNLPQSASAPSSPTHKPSSRSHSPRRQLPCGKQSRSTTNLFNEAPSSPSMSFRRRIAPSPSMGPSSPPSTWSLGHSSTTPNHTHGAGGAVPSPVHSETGSCPSPHMSQKGSRASLGSTSTTNSPRIFGHPQESTIHCSTPPIPHGSAVAHTSSESRTSLLINFFKRKSSHGSPLATPPRMHTPPPAGATAGSGFHSSGASTSSLAHVPSALNLHHSPSGETLVTSSSTSASLSTSATTLNPFHSTGPSHSHSHSGGGGGGGVMVNIMGSASPDSSQQQLGASPIITTLKDMAKTDPAPSPSSVSLIPLSN